MEDNFGFDAFLVTPMDVEQSIYIQRRHRKKIGNLVGAMYYEGMSVFSPLVYYSPIIDNMDCTGSFVGFLDETTLASILNSCEEVWILLDSRPEDWENNEYLVTVLKHAVLKDKNIRTIEISKDEEGVEISDFLI